MFYFACGVALFFLLFFVRGERYTLWMVLFLFILLLCSKMVFTTYEVHWNATFLLLFISSLFLFRVLNPSVNTWNLLIMIGMVGVYCVIEMIHMRYTEFIRIDLALMSGFALFFLAWFFVRNLRIAFCLSVCSLFFSVVLFAFAQLFIGRLTNIYIGTLTHLNEVGWMMLAFIFFSLCERIHVIEKNYG